MRGVKASELIVIFLGAGGVGVLPLVLQALKDRRSGRLTSEDTAITRWRDLATEREREAKKAWRIVDAYRRYYGPLWAAYKREGGVLDFPPDPTPRDEGAPP